MPLRTQTGTFYVPYVVSYITRLLAAGYALLQDYGPTVQNDTKDGDLKIKNAMDLLGKIQNNELPLLDYAEQPMSKTYQVSGWPDNTTASRGTDGRPEPPQVRMSQVF